MVKQMKNANASPSTLIDLLRNSWFLIVFCGTAIYWAARHDGSIADVRKMEIQVGAIEMRVATLESGLGQLTVKLDVIKEDLGIIKRAVIK
ncbi:MAG: hypothetical protein FWG18_03720 [Alphaproteobacteria bacterium]|nr:hypothetical protein [Alphaproteobacteria bacterium]